MPAKIHGRLAATRPTSIFGGALDTLYQVPAARKATLNLSACNFSASARPVRIAVLPSGSSSPTAADWIEYGVSIAVSGVLERTGLALSAGQSVRVSSDNTDVSFAVFGIEEDA
jgi:hypothetical protein